ncbi:MAG: insulinase family protein, partial [Paucibacter sp.]|nr:insulinase family protein [Roseateles sp.]
MSFKLWPSFAAATAVCLALLHSKPAQAADMQSPAGTRAVVSDSGHLSIRHEKFRLANGFEVILVEDHRLPLVAFNLWVHAGPRNESTGQTGFAHLFEHLMFAGSRHIPRGQADQLVEAAGGTDSNGSTDFDRTNYFFTLPSNQLELGLWIKSDMLGYMIDEVDAVALANQQDVVRNERRQSIENRPYGVVDEAAYQALFPEGHPYRAMVMGSHADIQSIRLADVKAFARTYYRPNNATLVLAGDFDPREARRLVEKYFGTLKAGPAVPPVAVPTPVITAERRLSMSDQVELPRLDMLWLTSPLFQPGDADLDVAAVVLGGGKASRLYKKLVVERQSAQSINVEQASQSLSSVFWLQVLARKSASLAAIEADVDAELADLATRGPTEAELQRARAEIETQMVARLEKVGTLADTVNYYNQQAGDPDYADKDLARYRAVTVESVRAAVATQLRKQARVLVQTQPGDKVLAPDVPTPPAPKAAGLRDRASLNAPENWRQHQPKATAAHALSLPQ